MTKLKQVQGKSYFSQLQKVKNLLVDSNVYEPIIINDNVNNNCRVAFFNLVKNIVTDGFCAIKNFDLFYFRLPSQGPHPAVHFIWKAYPNDINVDGENTKLVVSIRGEQKTFFSRASRKIIKKMLHRIGVVKFYKAEFIIRFLLGDASAPVNETENAILSRFDRYVRLEEDILCDLLRVIPMLLYPWPWPQA